MEETFVLIFTLDFGLDFVKVVSNVAVPAPVPVLKIFSSLVRSKLNDILSAVNSIVVPSSSRIKEYLSAVKGKNISFAPASGEDVVLIDPLARIVIGNDFLMVIVDSFKLIVAMFCFDNFVYNVLSEDLSNSVLTIFISETLTAPDACKPPCTTPATV